MLLVTGANGQLGTALSRVMPTAIYAGTQELDITNGDDVKRFVDARQISTIINCAAYTAVDKAEDDAARAFQVNAAAVKNLTATGARLIHLSTDYVFDGKNHRPYVEDDTPHPQSVYARSKHEGELAALSSPASAVVVRTSWIYSPWGNNFLKTMLHLGRTRETVGVVNDQVGSPTYALDLARVLARIAEQMKDGQHDIYHYANQGVCSWYDFACEIMLQTGSPCKVMAIESADYPSRVARPFYSVLNTSKIKKDFGIEIPHWKESLQTCLAQFS